MNIFIVFVVVGVGFANSQLTGRCGEEQVQGRIIGGTNILRCQWPYTPLVSIKLYYDDSFGTNLNFGNLTVCGGALIDRQHVVTSAICAAPFYGAEGFVVRQSARVLVGDFDTRLTDFGNDNTREDVIRIDQVRIHNGYDNITTNNNIAIIRLARPVNYNDCKQPACLKAQLNQPRNACDEPEVDDTCIMASVGLRGVNDPSTPPIPQQAPVLMFNPSVTQAIMRASPNNLLPQGAVIGRAVNPNVRACLFDWGGIVVCRNTNRWWLRGLISSSNCLVSNTGSTLVPPIFITEVANYRGWIDRCLNNIFDCPSL